MSTNCLVTKLKSSVSNSNLPKLGCVRIAINTLIDPNVHAQNVSGSYSAKYYDTNGNLINTWRQDPFNTYGENYRITTTGVMEITDKYNLSVEITARYIGSGNGCDIKEFSHCQNLLTLDLLNAYGNGGFYGNIEELVDVPNLTTLDVRSNNITGELENIVVYEGLTVLGVGTKITGDISSIGSLTSLTTLHLKDSVITGTIESFVQAQRQAGRTTNTTGIIIPETMGLVTIDGRASVLWDLQNNDQNNKLTWTENTITYGNGTKDKTVNA